MSEIEPRAGGGWLRPSYGRESFRVDVLWYDVRTSNPYDFFNKLWKALIANSEKLKKKQKATPLRTKDEIEEKNVESSAGSAIGKYDQYTSPKATEFMIKSKVFSTMRLLCVIIMCQKFAIFWENAEVFSKI